MVEQLERTAFVILQHLYAVAGVQLSVLTPEKLADDLGLTRSETNLLLERLEEAGYLEVTGGVRAVEISRRGIEYLNHRADRRRSVRFMAETA